MSTKTLRKSEMKTEINTMSVIGKTAAAHVAGLALIGAAIALSPHARADTGPRAWICTGQGIAQVAQPISRMCFFRPATGEELCFERDERAEVSICVDTSGLPGFPDSEWCGPDQKLGDVVIHPFEPLPEMP